MDLIKEKKELVVIDKKNELAIQDNKKMSLEDYMNKYNSKPQNMKAVRTFLFLLSASIGIIIVTCLFFMVVKLFELHEIAGYCGIGVAVLIFIFVYIIPLIKIRQTKAFMTVVDERNARQAQRYNKMLREEIADKMIDFHSKTDNIGWYTDSNIGKLAIARNQKNDAELKKALTDVYNTDVKKNVKRIISEHALKVGFSTAVSQSDKLDTLFVTCYDLDLIKQIVMMYGYRPSDAKLVKIYKTVITNALVSFGVQSSGKELVKGAFTKIGAKTTKEIPILGGILGTVIESTAQGILNASLTVLIGYQTKKYLRDEYHYQDILDNIDLSQLDNEERDQIEEQEILVEVNESLTKKNKDENKL